MEARIGHVTHYYGRIGVAVLSLDDHLTVGETIHILGHTTNFSQKVASMEVEHQKIQTAGPGDDVALKVIDTVRKGDVVYRMVETR